MGRRQIDSWFDRRIDRYVDNKLDVSLKGQMPDEEFEQLKAMTRTRQPLDEASEDRLREQLGDNFEAYKTVHSGVAKLERVNGKINSVTRYLP